jgi:hypothetical protein
MNGNLLTKLHFTGNGTKYEFSIDIHDDTKRMYLSPPVNHLLHNCIQDIM